MKRIRVVRTYDESRYPAATDEGCSRRGFLRSMTAGAAAAAAAATAATGALLLGSEEGAARPLGGAPAMNYRITIGFTPPYRYANCSTALSGVLAVSWDYRMAFFLRDAKERRGILKVLYRTLKRYKCLDVQDEILKRRLQRVLSKAVAELYQRRTKRRGYASLTLMTRPVKATCDGRLGPALADAPAGE